MRFDLTALMTAAFAALVSFMLGLMMKGFGFSWNIRRELDALKLADSGHTEKIERLRGEMNIFKAEVQSAHTTIHEDGRRTAEKLDKVAEAVARIEGMMSGRTMHQDAPRG